MNKIKFALSSFVMVAVCGTMHALAETSTNDSSNQDQYGSQNGRFHLGKMEKATKIMGMEIRDSQDQKLGKVKDLAIDMQNGRIVEVIVGTGGMLGVDQKYVAVPPGQFTCDAPKKELQLNVDRSRFQESPPFKMSDWESNVHEANLAGVYQYYGTQPYFTNDSQNNNNNVTPSHAAEAQTSGTQNNMAACRLGEVQRASKIIGSTVHNLHDERIGKVENLEVDLSAGRLVEVVISAGGFLGMDDELSAVPPQSFRQGTESDTLILDTTKAALTSAPHFKSGEWENANNPMQIEMVYHAYNVDPYFTTNAPDNTAQNVRDRSADALTPLKQGTSKADVQTSRQIRKAIIADHDLSVNAHNVKVITIDGRVTLRGPVNSEDEKRRIAEIAGQVASPANVDDQLQVQTISPTSSAKP